MFAYEPGIYLTDGTFLYRVDEVVATDAGEVAALEDCHQLGIVRIPMDELRARGLRLVTPEGATEVGSIVPALNAC